MDICRGEHEIYVADVVGVEKEGKVVVITVCRHCDNVAFHEKQISGPGVPLRLKSLEEKAKNAI